MSRNSLLKCAQTDQPQDAQPAAKANDAADEALIKSVRASLKVYNNEFLPAQEEAREITRRYSGKIAAEQQVITKLKSKDLYRDPERNAGSTARETAT